MSDLVGNLEDRFSHNEAIYFPTISLRTAIAPVRMSLCWSLLLSFITSLGSLFEHRQEKTGLRGFRPDPTQTTEDGWRLEISDLRRK